MRGNITHKLSSTSVPRFPDLVGQTVFITGGGSGIGAAFTRAFAAQGAKVGFVSLRRETADRLCDEVEQCSHIRPLFVRCDVRDIAQLREAHVASKGTTGPNKRAGEQRGPRYPPPIEFDDSRRMGQLNQYEFETLLFYDASRSKGHGGVRLWQRNQSWFKFGKSWPSPAIRRTSLAKPQSLV